MHQVQSVRNSEQMQLGGNLYKSQIKNPWMPSFAQKLCSTCYQYFYQCMQGGCTFFGPWQYEISHGSKDLTKQITTDTVPATVYFPAMSNMPLVFVRIKRLSGLKPILLAIYPHAEERLVFIVTAWIFISLSGSVLCRWWMTGRDSGQKKKDNYRSHATNPAGHLRKLLCLFQSNWTVIEWRCQQFITCPLQH